MTRTRIVRFVLGSTLLLGVAAFQSFAVEDDSPSIIHRAGDRSAVFAGDSSQAVNTATLDLDASATLTSVQATQPENIFLFSFPLPPGEQSFLGLKGEVSLTSEVPVFNESLNTVAINTSGLCPTDGSVFPNYTAVYAAYPNLTPMQGFILKNPDRGTAKVAIDYRMPVGLPVSGCMVLMLDWVGNSRVNMTSALKMIYATGSSAPSGVLLQTNQEFVFGVYIGPGSTSNDSLSFVQETRITQSGWLLAFVGNISDSTFSVPPPPGYWQTSNDIYLVPGRCPSDIPVISGGWTPMASDYYSDLPQDAQNLLSVPLPGFRKMAAQKFVYRPLNVKVESGDCLLTMFGLRAPKGGIDSENQVKALLLPSP